MYLCSTTSEKTKYPTQTEVCISCCGDNVRIYISLNLSSRVSKSFKLPNLNFSNMNSISSVIRGIKVCVLMYITLIENTLAEQCSRLQAIIFTINFKTQKFSIREEGRAATATSSYQLFMIFNGFSSRLTYGVSFLINASCAVPPTLSLLLFSISDIGQTSPSSCFSPQPKRQL